MTKHCDGCKYWDRHPVELRGNCNSEKFVYDEMCPEDGLVYWDSEGYSAGVHTGPKFGCVHWRRND